MCGTKIAAVCSERTSLSGDLDGWTSTGSHAVRVRTPDVIGDYLITVRPSDYVDDHPDHAATIIDFGVPIEVHAFNQYDRDIFTFAAAAGQSYEINVEPGTSRNFSIRLHDADGNELKRSHYPEVLRMIWQAWEDGDYFVSLSTGESGTCSISVSRSDYLDDHADDERHATTLTLSEPVGGLIGLDAGFFWNSRSRTYGDQDLFSFEAEAGKPYSIDVELGSLLRSDIQLYDAAGDFLDSADTRLVWEAASRAGITCGFRDL